MTMRGQASIEMAIRACRREGRAAFIPFVVAGDPDIEISERILCELAPYSDVMEVGIPYSDPLADGPVIQAGSLRALASGMNLPKALELIRRVRAKTEVPLIAFTYANPVLQYGAEKLAAALAEVGGDGLIVPDLPFEESAELRQAAMHNDLALVPLVALTSKDRIQKIVAQASGFVYCVSSLGVTGERGEFSAALETFVQTVRGFTELPVAIGFGVSQPEHMVQLTQLSDAVIVGSAIVRRVGTIAQAQSAGDLDRVNQLMGELVAYVQSMVAAGKQK